MRREEQRVRQPLERGYREPAVERVDHSVGRGVRGDEVELVGHVGRVERVGYVRAVAGAHPARGAVAQAPVSERKVLLEIIVPPRTGSSPSAWHARATMRSLLWCSRAHPGVIGASPMETSLACVLGIALCRAPRHGRPRDPTKGRRGTWQAREPSVRALGG